MMMGHYGFDAGYGGMAAGGGMGMGPISSSGTGGMRIQDCNLVSTLSVFSKVVRADFG